MSVEPVERRPFVLPPPPQDFLLTPVGVQPAGGQVVGVTGRPWLEGRVKHFSASSLRMLRICPEQYRQRYILGRKERPGGSLTLGSAFHEATHFNFEQKIETHEDLKIDEVIERFHDYSWPEAVASDGGVDAIRWDDGLKPDDYRRDGERMARAYHVSVAPRIQPVEKPEQRFDLWVPGIPVPFIGYIDVVEEANVIDEKTGKAVQRKPDANWRTQGGVYALVKQRPVHFHSISRAKTPSIATPLTDPDMVIPYTPETAAVTTQVLHHYKEQVEFFMHRYGPDDPWPTNGVFMDLKGGPACRYCGFRKFCPAWAHERTVTV
jgi:hypothetical protein